MKTSNKIPKRQKKKRFSNNEMKIYNNFVEEKEAEEKTDEIKCCKNCLLPM